MAELHEGLASCGATLPPLAGSWFCIFKCIMVLHLSILLQVSRWGCILSGTHVTSSVTVGGVNFCACGWFNRTIMPHGLSSLQCNVTCGLGSTSREVVCIDQAGRSAHHSLCDPGSKPVQHQPCQQEACQYTWRTGDWSEVGPALDFLYCASQAIR